jgi:hypothetical protein
LIPRFEVTNSETAGCLRFGKDIEPGDYVFVPREENIETPDKQVFTLESNLLQELGSPLFSVE